MSLRIIQSKYGLVLACLLGQIIFAAPVQAGVEDKRYNVNVNSSEGDSFTACFEFNADGTLTFHGQEATFGRRNLGKDQRNWQAVTKPFSEVSIALSGQVRGDFVPDRTISGDAINSNGTTFTFNGTRLSEATCPPDIQGISGENPFLK